MAGEAQVSPETTKEGAQDKMEDLIKSAILSRSSYFHDQADSLTFEGVRRLLEKDLGLKAHSLDSHKRFVKQWLQTCIGSAGSDKLPKSQSDAGDNAVPSTEAEEPVTEPRAKREQEEPSSGGGEILEDSPVMGLMTGPNKAKTNVDETEDNKSQVIPTEMTIKKALSARASYLRENSKVITLAGVRRLLEEDLELEKHTLDPFKKFISQQVDAVLNPPESPESNAIDKKKAVNKGSHGKVSSKSSKEEPATPSGDESDKAEEKEVKARKKAVSKGKSHKPEPVRKRKRAEEDTKGAKRKQSKVSKAVSEESGEENDGAVSEGDNSESSAEKPVKKKEVPKASYGKQVEHLKSIIKSCGMSIPPVIYKKVKQVPENKREACLIKELEDILAKEGLSTNPSEKEIKEVKRKKDRAKELEGIDMSNIVSSSRRRSATSFAPPPKPKIPDLSESESEESENDSEDDEEEGDEEVENEEADEDQENGGDASPSEDSDEDKQDSD